MTGYGVDAQESIQLGREDGRRKQRTISLGNIQYDLSRDVYLRCSANVDYKSGGGVERDEFTSLFTCCRDTLDSAFDALPAPTPSNAPMAAPAAEVLGCSSGKRSWTALRMRRYHQPGNPRFASLSPVEMADGRHLGVGMIRRGIFTSGMVSTCYNQMGSSTISTPAASGVCFDDQQPGEEEDRVLPFWQTILHFQWVKNFVAYPTENAWGKRQRYAGCLGRTGAGATMRDKGFWSMGILGSIGTFLFRFLPRNPGMAAKSLVACAVVLAPPGVLAARTEDAMSVVLGISSTTTILSSFLAAALGSNRGIPGGSNPSVPEAGDKVVSGGNQGAPQAYQIACIAVWGVSFLVSSVLLGWTRVNHLAEEMMAHNVIMVLLLIIGSIASITSGTDVIVTWGTTLLSACVLITHLLFRKLCA